MPSNHRACPSVVRSAANACPLAQGFGEGFSQGLQQGAQIAIQREQLKLQREQMKLDKLEQWRKIRQQEFHNEAEQWLSSVQSWREAAGQPRITQEEAMSKLDRLRVFDWERQNEQAWLKEK
jgi:hypothetical protein